MVAAKRESIYASEVTERPITISPNPLSKTQLGQRQTLQALDFTGSQKALAALPAVALSMFDQFAESFGLVDEDDLEDYLSANVPQFGRFFQQHRGAIEGTAAVVGAFIPGTLAIKAIRSKGMIANAAVKVFGKRNASFLTSTGKPNAVLFRKATQDARLLGIKQIPNLKAPGLSAFNKTKKNAILRSGHDIFVESIAWEVAVFSTMNQFDFLFPDQWSTADTLALGIGTSGIFGVAALGVARSAMVQAVQKSFRQGKMASISVTEQINAQVVGNRAGERGTALTARALFLQEAKIRLEAAKQSGDQVSIDFGTAEVTALREQMTELAAKAFNDSPITGVTKSIEIKPKSENSPMLVAAVDAIEQEPTLALGLRSLEEFSAAKFLLDNSNLERELATTKVNLSLLVSEVDEFKASIIKQRGELPKASRKQKDKLRRMSNKLQDLHSKYEIDNRTVAIVMELDGTISGASTRAAIFQDGARVITASSNKLSFTTINNLDITVGNDGKIFFTPETKAVNITLSETGELVGDNLKYLNAKSFVDLNHIERTAIYDVLQNRATHVALDIDKMAPIALTKDSHFTQIDYALELIARSDGKAVNKISGFNTVEDLEFQSLVGKFEAFQILSKQAAATVKNGGDDIYSTLDNLAAGLNLPKDDHALTLLFVKSQTFSDDIVPLTDIVGNMDSIKLAVKEMQGIAPEVELMGWSVTNNMLNTPLNKKPVLALIANLDDGSSVVQRTLHERVFAERAYQYAILNNAKDATMIQAILEVYKTNPEATALAKAELFTVIEGNLNEGVILKNFPQQTYRFRDQDAFASFDMLTDLSSKVTDQIIKRTLLEVPFLPDGTTVSQVLSKLKWSKNRLDLIAFQMAVNAKSAGWELTKKDALSFIKGKNGEEMAHLMIRGDSVKNRSLYKAMFNEEMPIGKSMPMPQTGSKTPVVLTQLGVDALKVYDFLSSKLLLESNVLRRAKGLPPIGKQQYHTPPVALTGKELGFLINKLGKVVTIIPAYTKRELDILMTKEIAAAEKNGQQLARASEETIRKYYAANSDQFFNTTDFSRTLNQTGASTGKLSRNVAEIGIDSFDRLIDTQIRQFTDVARETRMLMFAPEISFLKLQRAKTGIDQNTQTIYDDLISRIAGESNLTTKDVIGITNTALETLYNRGITEAWHQIGKVAKPTWSMLTGTERKLNKMIAESKIRFNDEFAPFHSMVEFMETTHQLRLPPNLRAHANIINEVTTGTSLRVMELGLGFINIATIASTLPVVTAALKPLANESLIEGTQEFLKWQKRTNLFTTTTPKGITFYSPVKAMTSTMHFIFTPEAVRIAEVAAKKGLLDQFAAERIATFARTGQSSGAALVRDLTDKLSFVTDKTELVSRSISFMHFYNLGRKLIGVPEAQAMAFANKHANNTIADFRPTNRPLIFQGAAGMPLGLFTTYMWNFLQRIGGMVEAFGTGGGRVAAIQAGLQTSLWGAESLPGWQQYTETFLENYDGSVSVVDRLNKSMGSFGADVFLNGTVSNLPRLMGISDEGISIGPRASIGLPFPSGINPVLSSPGVQLMFRAGETIGAIFDSTIENQGIDAMHLAEILAASNLNKGLSNMIELGITNKSLDRQGNLIEPSVELGVNIATGARLMGFRPLFADELRRENVRNRKTDRIRRELLARLGKTLKSKIIGGRLTSEDVESALESYRRAGGNAENFDTYFKGQIMRGTESKLSAEIAKALRKSVDADRFARLIYLDRD